MKKILMLLFIFCLGFSIYRHSFVLSDEAVNLQMVKNMQYSSEFILRPSYDPGGHPDWKNQSVSQIQMLPVFHYVYLFFNKILPGSLIQTSTIVQSLFLLFLIIIFSFSTREFKIFKHESLEIIFLGFVPVSYLMLLEHEGMMTVCGFISLYFAAIGMKKKSVWSFFFSGVFLGLSYLAKLWLAGPFGIGLLFILGRSIYRKEYSIGNYFLYSSILLGSFIVTSSIHLLFVYFYSPVDLSTWLKEIYFGLLSNAQSGKDKIGNVEDWNQPTYYYVFIFVRDLIGLLPIIILGLLNIKNWKKYVVVNHFNFSIIGVFLSFVCLSFINTKEPMYILPSLVAFIFLVINIFENFECSKKDLIKITSSSVVIFCLFFLGVFQFKLSKTVDLSFFGFQFFSFSLSFIYLYLYKYQKKNKMLLLTILIFALPFNFLINKSQTKFLPVIDYIMDHRPPNASVVNPYIIADSYSHIGFSVWNRVMKYDWLVKDVNSSEQLKNLLENPQYKFFVVDENTENGAVIKEIAKSLNYKLISFNKVTLIDKAILE